MKMALTSTENKRFRAQDRPGPIFMLGGAPTAHDVLSECEYLLHPQLGHFPIPPHLLGIKLFRALSHECGGPSAMHQNSAIIIRPK
jgi:hypothetical protein